MLWPGPAPPIPWQSPFLAIEPCEKTVDSRDIAGDCKGRSGYLSLNKPEQICFPVVMSFFSDT